MRLYAELLEKILEEAEGRPRIFGFKINADKIIEKRCYQALKEIKSVLDDDTLNDKSCFNRIEEIVCIYERMGSNGGIRHDFG